MRALFAAVAVIAALAAAPAQSLAEKIGAVAPRRKWESPRGFMLGVACHLEREACLVADPEMPWSGRRSHDKEAATFASEIDAAVHLNAPASAKQALKESLKGL